MTMDMQFRLFFLLSLGFVTILKTEGIIEDRLFLISPRPRSSFRNDSCMIRTEKSKEACCVCPGECGQTYPRTVSRTYSMGVEVFRLYFAIKGPGNKSNFSVHLYICPRNSTSDVVLQECLLKNPLRIISTLKNDKVLKLDVEVPPNLTCRHCLIQWAITKDAVPTASDFTKQYFGCSDIAILNENERSYEAYEIGSGTGDSHSTTVSTSIGTTQAPFQTSHGITTPHLTTVPFCWAVGVYAKVPGMTEWCYINCMRGYCPISHCRCTSKTSTTLRPTTTPLPTTLKLVCHGSGLYAGVNGMDQWCQRNCLMGYCPGSHCKCTSGVHGTTKLPVAISSKTTTQTQSVCRAIGIQATVPGMHIWCANNCMRGYCPKTHCKCSSSAETSRPHQTSNTTTPNVFTTRLVNPTIAPVALSSKTTTQTQSVCRAIGIQATVPGMHIWCANNCMRGYCPKTHCKCSSSAETSRPHQTPNTTTPNVFTTRLVNPTIAPVALSSKTTTQTQSVCRAIGIQATVPGMHIWCANNCMRGYCPKTHCKCSSSAETSRPHQTSNTTTPNVFTTRLVNPTIAPTTSTLRPLTKATTYQPSASTTALTNIRTTPALYPKTKLMPPLLSLKKREQPTVTSKTTPATTVTTKIVPASTVTSKFVPASTVTGATTPTSKVTDTSSHVTTLTHKSCKATGVFAGVVGMDNWCNTNCNNGYCPKFQCTCDDTLVTTTVSTCRAIYPYDQVANMHRWCKTNCAIGYCPSTHCRC